MEETRADNGLAGIPARGRVGRGPFNGAIRLSPAP